VNLLEGEFYYIEVYHTKGSYYIIVRSELETAGAELTVSVEIPSSEFRVNSIAEKVLISIDSMLELEKYFIKLYGQTGGE